MPKGRQPRVALILSTTLFGRRPNGSEYTRARTGAPDGKIHQRSLALLLSWVRETRDPSPLRGSYRSGSRIQARTGTRSAGSALGRVRRRAIHQGLDPIGDPLHGLAKLADGPVGGVSVGAVGSPVKSFIRGRSWRSRSMRRRSLAATKTLQSLIDSRADPQVGKIAGDPDPIRVDRNAGEELGAQAGILRQPRHV